MKRFRPLFPARAALALALALTLPLDGCSSLKSTGDPRLAFHGDHPVKATNTYYLPKGMIQAVGAPDAQNHFVVTLSTVLQPEVERRPFYIRYTPGVFSNDYLRTQVSPSGLLQSVVFMDANPNWGVANAGVLPTVSLAFSNAGKPAPFTRRVDPFDPASLAAFNRAFGGACRLRFRLPAPVQVSTRTHDGGRVYQGVVFHPGLPVTAEATVGGDTQQALLVVPDRRVTLAFDFNRSILDQRGTEIDFMDGMLTTVHVTNVGLFNAILGIPKSIFEAVFPVPPGW